MSQRQREQANKRKAQKPLFGIDVSHYQGTIDWSKVAPNVNFAFIKATEGSSLVDKNFKQNRTNAKLYGVPAGGYHFMRANAPLQAQIDNFLKAVGKLEPGELPPVLDVEIPEPWLKLSLKKRLELVHGWLKAVKKALGVDPIIYMSPSFAQVLGNDPGLAAYPLWVAHYTKATKPTVPKPFPFWTFWQYSDKGTVAGIQGAVDVNRFNGDKSQLDKFKKR